MITAQNILEALTENLDQIHIELQSDWPRFCRELASLRKAFIEIRDRNTLAIAVDKVWWICLDYPFVRDLIRTYGTEPQMQLPPSGGECDKISDREIINRFQSLLASLEEYVQPEENGRQQSGNAELSGTGNDKDR